MNEGFRKRESSIAPRFVHNLRKKWGHRDADSGIRIAYLANRKSIRYNSEANWNCIHPVFVLEHGVGIIFDVCVLTRSQGNGENDCNFEGKPFSLPIPAIVYCFYL